MKAIILAGGKGTRLWPLSREDFPKQFISFGSNLSLLQKTVRRLLNTPFIDDIVISTNSHHQYLVEQQIKNIDAQSKVKILIEPNRRNTAPAIGLAVKFLEEFCQGAAEDPVLVMPADHLIEPEPIFLHALDQMQNVSKDSYIITFGIRPTKPETGYGYIRIGQKYNPFTFLAEQFVEKPNKATAQKYMEDPLFFWNAGIFMFSVQTFWQQMRKYSSDLYKLMQGSFQEICSRFDQMPDLSIDYAIMEKSKEILLCPLAVSWSDIGSWDSIYDVMEKDQNQNVKLGNVLDIDTKNSLIVGENRLISTIGIEDMVIVETQDAVFVSKKGESQQVKDLVNELTRIGRKETSLYLHQTYPWGALNHLEENKDYKISKVEIFPKKTMIYSKRDNTTLDWMTIKGSEDQLSHKSLTTNTLELANLSENSIHLILVEKCV